MGKTNRKSASRMRRKTRIRGKVSGTPERPRLTVFRSSKHIYAQVIDDNDGRTLAAASDLTAGLREEVGELKKRDKAYRVGQLIASICKERGIGSVVFDRNGFGYHGRIKAVAEGAREGGLEF